MRNALTVTLATGLMLGLTGAASACGWNKTAESKMTVAQADKGADRKVEEAVTTFEPVAEDQLEEKVADED